jgi:hypothetical protein
LDAVPTTLIPARSSIALAASRKSALSSTIKQRTS